VSEENTETENIVNERQNYKIGTVCVGYICGRRKGE
jgi:hypothetical protein